MDNPTTISFGKQIKVEGVADFADGMKIGVPMGNIPDSCKNLSLCSRPVESFDFGDLSCLCYLNISHTNVSNLHTHMPNLTRLDSNRSKLEHLAACSISSIESLDVSETPIR